MKTLISLMAALVLFAATATAQVPVTYTFDVGDVIYSSQINTNFNDLASNALNRAGGVLTGNLVVSSGVTIDGIDISAYLNQAVLTTSSPTFAGLTVNGTSTLAAANMSGLLTNSAFGTHTFSAGGTGSNTLGVRNTTAGTGNYSTVQLGNDATASLLQVLALSSTYTTSGSRVASGVVLDATGAGGLSVLASNASGVIRFYTGGSTERAQLNGSGYLGLNDTSPGAYLSVNNDPAVVAGFRFSATNSGSGTIGTFRSVTTGVGSITVTGSATAYNTSSDQRLKADRGLATDLSGLRALKVHEFVWTKTQTSDRGVFAQEAAVTHPRAVHVGTDEIDNNGDLVDPWQVDYSKFVPDLIVGWQQHEVAIRGLAERVQRLERKR